MEKKDIIEKAIKKLKDSNSVHSVILFGSVAKGEDRKDSDIDLCIVGDKGEELSLDEKLKLNRDLPEKIEISFFNKLPLDIRSRVFKEGKVLYTEDKYQLLKLLEETDFELPYYVKRKEEYHKKAMERAKIKADNQ